MHKGGEKGEEHLHLWGGGGGLGWLGAGEATEQKLKLTTSRAVIKRWGRYFSPATFVGKQKRNVTKIKLIPSCLIPRLLVVFTRHLEIVMTSLYFPMQRSLLIILLAAFY